jgi:Zn-dependent protease with chaperone function
MSGRVLAIVGLMSMVMALSAAPSAAPSRDPAATGRTAPAPPPRPKQVRIRGYVTQVNSPTEFEIEDYRITRDGSFALDFENASPEVQFQLHDIRVGVDLQVRGWLDERTRNLKATAIKVDLEQFKSSKQTAIVSSVPDAMTRTATGWTGHLQADGQTITITPTTRIVFKPTKREKKRLAMRSKASHAPGEENDFTPLTSLDQVTVGMAMTYEGRRDRETGRILADKVEFSHNDLEDGEAKLWKSLKISTKAARDLRPGELKIDRIGKFRLVRNDAIQAYVEDIGRRLIPAYQTALASADPRKIPFQFHVVVNSNANAFATPNGIVIINSGLIALLENEAQLAAVLGHEIAHATHEHTWRQQEFHKKKRIAIGIAGAIAGIYGLGGVPDIAALLTAAIGSGHSRALENQSDRVGLQYMVAAGYDPREAPKVWKLMTKVHGLHPTNVFWSSHENQAARRSYLMNELKNNYRDLDYAATITRAEPFQRIKHALAGSLGQRRRIRPAA